MQLCAAFTVKLHTTPLNTQQRFGWLYFISSILKKTSNSRWRWLWNQGLSLQKYSQSHHEHHSKCIHFYTPPVKWFKPTSSLAPSRNIQPLTHEMVKLDSLASGQMVSGSCCNAMQWTHHPTLSTLSWVFALNTPELLCLCTFFAFIHEAFPLHIFFRK